jgi:hypothetical protein
MENDSGEKHPPAEGVTAEGIVEAIEQDVELSIEQARNLAHNAVAAVEKKLGVGNPRARRPPPTKMKPRSIPAKKATAKANKSSKPAKASPASKGKPRKR